MKRASLESSLGQYGQAAVKDLQSVFKNSKKKQTQPQSRLPTISNKHMSRSPSVNSLSPNTKKQQQAGKGTRPIEYHQPCSEETKINWVKDVNNFEHKLSPFRVVRDPMGNTLDSTGFDFVAFKQSVVGSEPRKMVSKPQEAASISSKIPGSRMYYNDILAAMNARVETIGPKE